MTTLTITHTHQEGTLIHGTTKGDGTAAILKTHRWRWGRTISCWYLPCSRDRLPKMWDINRTVTALEAGGFAVTTALSRETRPTADVEADKKTRADARTDALEAKAARKRAASAAAWDKMERQRAIMPPMGEPIKIGHHSERRHRKAFDDMHRLTGAWVEALDDANRVGERAETSSHATERRYNPETVGNRINTLEAELRDTERHIAGTDQHARYVATRRAEETATREGRTLTWTEYDNIPPVPASGDHLTRLEARRADITDQLDYWRTIRAEQINTGQAFGPGSVTVGDSIKRWGDWYKVIRVNKKSVTVQTDQPWTSTVPWQKIQAVKKTTSKETLA